jgi:hypothetical protein
MTLAQDSKHSISTTSAAGRRVSCPECGLRLLDQEEPEHLITAHGYITLSGALMPHAAALSCLWDRVFAAGDSEAHERLRDLLQGDAPESGQPTYPAALETELIRRLDTPLAKRRRDLERLVGNLRKSDGSRSRFWDLLSAADPRIRKVGRELLLPDVGQSLADKQTTAAEVRRRLEQLCPVEDVWNKIQVCQRLPHFGADPAAVKQCLRELRQERPVACPECGAAVPGDELDGHLWRAHRIYQFRGTRHPLPDLIEALLIAVCNSQADVQAWTTLENLAREEYGERAEAFLATRLVHTLQSLDEARHRKAVPAVAELLAVSDNGPRIALALAESSERRARSLALTLVQQLPPPYSRPLIRAIRPLLARKRAPQEVQLAVAAAFLRGTGKEGKPALKILNALITRCSKARAVERLRLLEERTGPSAVLTQRCLEIENRIRMSCPRCRVQLRRPDMTQHLWSQHRLLLDGRRARHPWRLIKEWLKAYRRRGNAELLMRCRTLGEYLDPENGLRRVHRLVLALGIEDVEARQVLLAEARQRRATLCPRCYSLVPLPEEVVPRPLNRSHGRLSLEGYCVEVSERGLVPRLRIETPIQVVFDGREPERWLTRRAATLLAAGPLVMAALLFAVLLPRWGGPAQGPVIASIVLAVIAYLTVHFLWRRRPQPVERAVDYAWTWLVPRLHAGTFSTEDARFVSGLALTTLECLFSRELLRARSRSLQGSSPRSQKLAAKRGNGALRAQSLQRVVRLTENAFAGGVSPLVHLVLLRRLEAAHLAALGQDPIPTVAQAVGRCFDGKPPLSFAQQLLAEWEGGWWTAGNLARLRVLLCDQAFQAGREVRDLLDAGHLAPALGEVLQVDRREFLAQLRLLWSLRPSRPWDRWSEGKTVFDLALDPERGRQLLSQYPDLLLVDQAKPEILICGRGVVFNGILFTEHPDRIEAKARKEIDHVDYEAVVGEHRFPFPSDPGGRILQLQRWFRYFFDEFVPQVAGVHSWHAPGGTRPLRLEETLPCPECRRMLIPQSGRVGTIVDQ